jgi:hypothetical protein
MNSTPKITFSDGILKIEGRSLPEDANMYYASIVSKARQYVLNPLPSTTLIVDMDYVNTSSSKCLVTLAKILATAPNFNLEWHYEEDDEDIKELGEIFQSILKIKVKFFEKIM